MTIAEHTDPEWTDEKRRRMLELEARKEEARVSVLAQRRLRDRVQRGELSEDVKPEGGPEFDP